jgi:hypothetical protein
MQIEHRKISLFAAPDPGTGSGARVALLPQSGHISTQSEFEACPPCGSPGKLLPGKAVALAGLDLAERFNCTAPHPANGGFANNRFYRN